MKRVYLYGLADASEAYKIVWHSYIDEEYISIKNIACHAAWLRLKNPTIKHVYAIDMRPGLANDYKRTIKKNSIEGNVIFKDMLETEGLLII